MSQSQLERRYEALRLFREASPIALAPAHAADRGIERGRSTRRCQRKPPRLVASGLVVNAIMLDGSAFWLTIPDPNRSRGWRIEHDLADRVANHFRDAAPGSGSSLAQGVKLFL